MAAKYGEAQVKLWRRGYDVELPPITKESEMYPGKDPLYADLKESEIPLSENLKKVVERVIPYWEAEIVPVIKSGRKIIIAASGNSLRALMKHLEKLSDAEIVEVDMPTGIPLVYELDQDFKVVKKTFLADEEKLSQAIQAVKNQGKAKQ
jgi:2,3-bisphosphoglycerate-dependent phosphoglycerate mutase